jgi:hypothetical protein
MKKLLAQMMLILIVMFTSSHVSAEEIISINEINTSPVNFDGKEVKLKGIAKNPTRIPLVNLKAYVLQDESGEITILTESDLPRMNEEISIRVRVESLAIIQGEALGLMVTELERYEQ